MIVTMMMFHDNGDDVNDNDDGYNHDGDLW